MIIVIKASDVGNDVLEVTGYDSANPAKLLTGHGWVSAVISHYDSSAYAATGHLKPNAKSRSMTSDEQGQYLVSLLGPMITHDILFEDSEAHIVHTAAVAAAKTAKE